MRLRAIKALEESTVFYGTFKSHLPWFLLFFG